MVQYIPSPGGSYPYPNAGAQDIKFNAMGNLGNALGGITSSILQGATAWKQKQDQKKAIDKQQQAQSDLVDAFQRLTGGDSAGSGSGSPATTGQGGVTKNSSPQGQGGGGDPMQAKLAQIIPMLIGMSGTSGSKDSSAGSSGGSAGSVGAREAIGPMINAAFRQPKGGRGGPAPESQYQMDSIAARLRGQDLNSQANAARLAFQNKKQTDQINNTYNAKIVPYHNTISDINSYYDSLKDVYTKNPNEGSVASRIKNALGTSGAPQKSPAYMAASRKLSFLMPQLMNAEKAGVLAKPISAELRNMLDKPMSEKDLEQSRKDTIGLFQSQADSLESERQMMLGQVPKNPKALSFTNAKNFPSMKEISDKAAQVPGGMSQDEINQWAAENGISLNADDDDK